MYHSQQDLEAYDFAWGIQRAILKSGFIVNIDPRPLPVESPDPLNRLIPRLIWERAGAGVTIKISDRELSRRRAQALVDTFTAFGFKSTIGSGDEAYGLLIIVGPKP
jgi:hypothetical protein